ncbi:TPA: hypothetical protein AABQ15_001525 [Neisseria gonorrhoeae]
MKCPFCSHPDTRVADSRLMEERNTVRLTEHRLYTSGQRDISSSELVEIVLEELFGQNTEAAVRFAALHKRFDSPEHFASWLAQAVKTGGKT